jgi:hypothetical protein
MSPIIDALTAQVTRAVGIVVSAVITINGIAQRIADAVAAALANGATAEQLQPVADLGTALDSESTVLADAIAANQPPPGP